MVSRGEIYYADLSPVIGSEQGGVRPVLIVQNDVGNKFSPTVIAAAVTGKLDKKFLPTHVTLPFYYSNLPKDSVVLAEQVRTIDRKRLKDYVGKIPSEFMTAVDKALLISFGLNQGREV